METVLHARAHLEEPTLRPQITVTPTHTVQRLAIVGNHAPRRCGIATFTTDLATWLERSGCEVDVYAVGQESSSYDYPDRVRGEIRESDPEAYRWIARQIDRSGYDVVSVQHEYGIYGGRSGDYLLTLLNELNTAVVTTLHTILQSPSTDQFRVMSAIVERSRKLVVMSQRGRAILEAIHSNSKGKIEVIPHGTPDASACDRGRARQKLGLAERKTVLTFGLLSRDKGIDQMIMAMDLVRRAIPEALFVVVGATHPHILEREGESCRESLEKLVEELDLQDNVRFVNEFVPLETLVEWLVACDVYVCPYLKLEQVTSGTLSYAFGLGKPIVSTPNWHAIELLAEGGGSLVPPKEPTALAKAVIEQLSGKATIRIPDDGCVSEMQWSNVAQRYKRTFARAIVDKRRSATVNAGKQLPVGHLVALTDDVGIVQHGIYNLPRRAEGYCTDDNARALMVVLGASGMMDESLRIDLERRYLAFLVHAFDEEHSVFRNFMGYDRQWLETYGSQDSQARAIWSLGHVASESLVEGHRTYAVRWFRTHAGTLASLTAPRAIAFALLGLHELFRATWTDELNSVAIHLAEKFRTTYVENATPEWPWWESILTYDNARLPQALFVARDFLDDDSVTTFAAQSLRWLCQEQTADDGSFAPIGCRGFYRQGQLRAIYDQQPIEALATIQACLTAFHETQDEAWMLESRRAWGWFGGLNMVGLPMVTDDGGCYDGLMADGVNLNQGAESTLAYLASCVCLNSLRLPREIRHTRCAS